MNSHYISLANLILICLSFLASVLLFQYGFLLKRREIRSRSECTDVSYTRGSCWLPAQYKRAIVIVIDALRYDFAAPSYSKYSGYLPTISEVLRTKNDSTVLMHFTADPPTTTMQRLKGLTTGSLPTFIDVASNFASSEVMEDNWVDQIYRSGRNITFLGDDTWVSLFPSKFHRSHHVPSFDINDLHGVDNVVLEHIYDELARPDWSVLIAHFLGVDHCGHKYGPDHPEMVKKLSQMDEMIHKVIAMMDNETLLVIFGDHGMTETGDHGGDAQLEIDAALFMYSHKRLLFSDPPDAVSQVDLVPTLSLLLDSPIPFSNIGVVIDCLIPANLRSIALSSNVWQIDRYAQLMVPEVPDLYSMLREFEVGKESEEGNIRIMRNLQQMFRSSWTHFSVPFMRVGIESVLEAMFGAFGAYFTLGEAKLDWLVFRSALFFVQISSYLNGNEESDILKILEILLVTSLLIHLIRVLNWVLSFSFSIRHITALLFVIAHAASFLSNSFIVFESSSVRFLVQSVLLVAILATYSSSHSKVRTRRSIPFGGLQTLFGERFFVVLLLLILLRVGIFFENCREEQQSACSATILSQPLAKLPPGYEKNCRFLLSAVALIGASYVSHRILRDFYSHLSLSIFPTVIAITIHWMTQFFPEKAAERFASFSLRSAQVAYGFLLFNIILICLQSVKCEIRSLRACSISLMISLSLYLCLLLGDGLSISFIIFAVIIILGTDIIHDELMMVLFFVILSSHGFFALSHHATFSAIPWQAGFVGVQGNFFIQAVPATLIISHLFSSQIIVAAALPYSVVKLNVLDAFGHYNGLLRRSFLFVFLHAFKVFFVCVAALVHRRHLMVWKIFAPKFVFESVSFLVVCALVVFVNFVFRNLNLMKLVK